MTIEAKLSKEQFIRLSILRHIQRIFFYVNAAVGAALSAYALVRGPFYLIYLAWIPLVAYLIPGLVATFQQAADENNPLFLPTRYEFTRQGVSIENSQNEGFLEWGHIATWKIMAHCYVFFLTAGPIVAIPQAAVPAVQKPQFEELLTRHLEQWGK